MKFGIVIPLNDARTAADMAREAEQAGWDGFFIGEAIWSIDAWVTLGAAAIQTERIRLGTMVSPLPQMTPWKLAAESATLDRLSNGRAILGLGMGAVWMGWQAFPEYPTDPKARAERLDEGIDILNQLYRRKQFDYAGKHYQVRLTTVDEIHYPPPPIQQPRVPLWVIGVWPRIKSMQRVLKCDGLIPAVIDSEGKFIEVQPEHLREIKAYIDANRTLDMPFDFIVESNTVDLDATQARAKIQPWIDAGATWWLETLFGLPDDTLLARVRQGPPRL